MPDEEIGDRGGLLDGHQMGGAGYDRKPGVRDPGDQGAGLGGAGDLVLGADQHERGHPDAAELRAHVEGGERLAGGDVAAGVGGAHHLHRPLGDRGLGGGEALREPPVGALRAIGSRPFVRTITPR